MLKKILNLSSILLGKSIQKISQLRGGGSALPGLVIEKINPKFIKATLSGLPRGVIVISGTNGKTTTTKIVTELLRSQGLRVFTNDTGSNFVRGVISSIISTVTITGHFNYDIAVLELDEAHSRKFAAVAPISYALLLNVSEDQLDRFGSTKNVANLLSNLARHAKLSVITNREDELLSQITHANLHYFGLAPKLRTTFLTEDQASQKPSPKAAEVILQKFDHDTATFKIGHHTIATPLKLKGAFNAFNAAAALTLVKTIFPDSDDYALMQALAHIDSAVGRGEVVKYRGHPLELILVKNPASFQLSIASFADSSHDYMIALNNHVADGQDISWLRKVNYSAFKTVQVCTGECAIRATSYLKEDEVKVLATEPNLKKALDLFVQNSRHPQRIFANYTALFELRKLIKKH